MSIVTLVSGGLDSSLVALMAMKDSIIQYPLFIDYGQLGHDREFRACKAVHAAFGLPIPVSMNLSGFGKTIPCGLTDSSKDIFADAFLPGRNMLFILAGSAYAHQMGANAVAIGLLNEATHLFPDQTTEFLKQAERMISICMGKAIKVIAPLISFYKADVIRLAQKYGLTGTYSCHSGREKPCGICISCREMLTAKKEEA